MSKAGISTPIVKRTPPTIRSLAKALKCSATTVSEALRGVPRVNARTALEIREAAAAAGYRPNPLASAIMSQLRRSRAQLFRGTLAATALDEAERPAYAARFFNGLIRGATERANQLGFGLETFLVGQRGVRLPRLDSILRSRGIRGIILLPAWDTPDFTLLDWSQFAGVYTDYIIETPGLHAVCSDHYRSMINALQRLHALGYRKPGLFMRKHQDQRLQHRWEAAFLAFQQHTLSVRRVPPLVQDDISRTAFLAWFRRYRPDVVIGHHSEVMEWMKEAGLKIPEQHGFFCLNVVTQKLSCAGLDLQPFLLGARAAEIVIAELQHSAFGIPENPSLTTMPARWVDGPTLRAQQAAGNHSRSPRVWT